MDVFNHILTIEQQQLKQNGVTLSITEVHVIEAIDKVEVKTMGNIARKLRVTLGTLTTSMDRLVKKGFVKRVYDENDRRKVLIELLDDGIEVLKEHTKFHEEMLEKLFLDTTIQEDELLINSLNNISQFFKDKY
ncbi:MAG: MarR family transcriptional regulator [bacterium]